MQEKFSIKVRQRRNTIPERRGWKNERNGVCKVETYKQVNVETFAVANPLRFHRTSTKTDIFSTYKIERYTLGMFQMFCKLKQLKVL